jgi:hypothetical protein
MNTTLRESPGAQCLRLQEEARLARKRFQLYKAKSYGPGVTNQALLFKLERAFLIAENRLRRANPAVQVSRVPPVVART